LTNRSLNFSLVLSGLLTLCVWAAPANAQMSAVKEKPPMYWYVANWQIPRAQWSAVDKSNADDTKILEKAVADGLITEYGFDESLVHSPDGATHDQWWGGTSVASVFDMLDQFYKAGTPTSPVFESATKHWDEVWVSRYYDSHPGSYKNAYTFVATYRLKPTAPDDALDNLSKNLVGPLLDKLLADGSILEWEIDTQEVHTDAPGEFLIIYVGQKPDAQDKINAAIAELGKSDPLAGPAFDSVVDSSGHRDEVFRSTATFK
jgi:hypothetical protein